jgi:DNA-binding GntR family transcriptional regulator/transposase
MVDDVADTPARLSPDERETLLRTGRSRHTPNGVAVRARLVADCADLGIAEAARRSSVSQATAAKWWRRYRTGGINALHDAPRTGRPPAPEEAIHLILNCSLNEPPPGVQRWTTRTVADAAGVSQATVSRIRRRYFRRPDPSAEPLLSNLSTSILTYVNVHTSGCALGFHAVNAESTRLTPTPTARVDVIETILCAALLCRPFTGHDPTSANGSVEGLDAVAVLRRAAERLRSNPGRVTLVVDVDLDRAAQRWVARHPEIAVYSVTGERWLGMLNCVADAVDPRQFAELRDVQRLVRLARREGAREFAWLRTVDSSTYAVDPTSPAVNESPTGDHIHVVRGICSAISAGELHAGDTISVRLLAERSGISSGRVANALAQLADEALIDRRAGRYRVPVPTPRDVIETYTARGLLGTAIARRLASLRNALPPEVDEHYSQLIRCDQLGLVPEAANIDLDLQDELARAAAMPRMGWMFIRLTLQLRIFVSIFGLSYRYPTDEILADDHRILVEIRRREPAAAVAAWRSKIDNCGRFMLAQLSAND